MATSCMEVGTDRRKINDHEDRQRERQQRRRRKRGHKRKSTIHSNAQSRMEWSSSLLHRCHNNVIMKLASIAMVSLIQVQLSLPVEAVLVQAFSTGWSKRVPETTITTPGPFSFCTRNTRITRITRITRSRNRVLSMAKKGRSNKSSKQPSDESSSASAGDTEIERHKSTASKGFGFDPSKVTIVPNSGTMTTALCIVPPDEAWDNIQRARHYTRDPTFYQWPPAIRLFHPFVPRSKLTSAATSIAQVVEKYNLEPFEITLDQLLIVPHFEVLEELDEAQKVLPTQVPHAAKEEGEEEDQIQALIQAEEEKGKKKLKRRRDKETAKSRAKIKKDGNVQDIHGDMNDSTFNNNNNNNNNNVSLGNSPNLRESKALSPRQRMEQQKHERKKFNGPCIICLEPNEESRLQLQAFREILRKKLFHEYDAFSVSSAVSTNSNQLPRIVLEKHTRSPSQPHAKSGTSTNTTSGTAKKRKKNSKVEGCTFRPVLTLGRFPNVAKAVKAARKLQQLWEPLTFRVSDLHLVSTMDPLPASSRDGIHGNDDASTNAHKFNGISDGSIASGSTSGPGGSGGDGGGANHGASKGAYGIRVDEHGTPILPDNRELVLRKLHGTDESESLLTTRGEYGCDAMVMLMGEEDQILHSSSPGDNVDGDEDSEANIENHQEEERILELLMSEAGIAGGGQRMTDNPVVNHHDVDPGDNDNDFKDDDASIEGYYENEDVEGWLDDDEEWDEGATIVIGRTHFFMGEMRQYIGMPASSTMDGKDRVLGDGVSASARRRGAVHRQGDRWNSGDFGQKERDYLP